ncbi:MerR family transcriptional regulator [Actinomadura fulvescens]|uniref:HTH merR-type domain-containing protein n=1 Tax=Actinomadura fulvescens TaxID=46160 RepID=A0ABN3QUL5_9ACTN
MRFGALSRLTGVSVRVAALGLLRPLRRPSGYREYRAEDAATVRGVAAGIGTATVGELRPCMTDDGEALTPAPDLHGERVRLSAAAAELLAARQARHPSSRPPNGSTVQRTATPSRVWR